MLQCCTTTYSDSHPLPIAGRPRATARDKLQLTCLTISAINPPKPSQRSSLPTHICREAQSYYEGQDKLRKLHSYLRNCGHYFDLCRSDARMVPPGIQPMPVLLSIPAAEGEAAPGGTKVGLGCVKGGGRKIVAKSQGSPLRLCVS